MSFVVFYYKACRNENHILTTMSILLNVLQHITPQNKDFRLVSVDYTWQVPKNVTKSQQTVGVRINVTEDESKVKLTIMMDQLIQFFLFLETECQFWLTCSIFHASFVDEEIWYLRSQIHDAVL